MAWLDLVLTIEKVVGGKVKKLFQKNLVPNELKSPKSNMSFYLFIVLGRGLTFRLEVKL